MGKLKNINKKILLCSLFFSLFGILTFWLYFLGSQEKNVEISAEKGRAYITNVNINRTSYLLDKFANEYKLAYSDGKAIIESDDIIKISASKITNIHLKFESINEESAIILVKNGTDIIRKEINNNSKDNFITTNKQLRVEFINFFQENFYLKTIISILLFIFLNLLLYKMFYYLMNLLKRKDSKKTFTFKELISSFIIILITLSISLYSLMSILNIYMIIFYFLFIVLIGINTYKYLCKNLSNLFCVLASIFGITMILLLPPFHVPDEGAHYFKAYSIYENENVFTHKSKSYIGLSSAVAQPINLYNMDLLGYDYKVSVKDYFSDKMHYTKDSDKKYSFYFDNTVRLSALCYIPAAAAISLTETIGLPFMISYRLAKIINLLIFIIAGFHCLKILPKFKNIFFMILLFPITIQQAGGICQDSLTLVLCVLFLAYVIKCIYENKKVDLYDKISLIIIPLLLGFCKIGYFPITFLILLVKNDKFKDKKEAILIKALSILPCLSLSMVQYLFAGSSAAANNFYPISMIFTQPITIIKVCLKTLFNRFHFDMLTGLVDGFGWSTIWNLRLVTFFSSFIYLIFLLTNGESIKNVNLKHRISYFVCSFVIIGLIYASLLFAWTPVGNSEIDGLQCRYFIIPALIFYIAFSNSNMSLKIKNREFWMGMCVSFVHIACFFSILVGFYY